MMQKKFLIYVEFQIANVPLNICFTNFDFFNIQILSSIRYVEILEFKLGKKNFESVWKKIDWLRVTP